MEERTLTLSDLLLMFKRRQQIFWLVLVVTLLVTGIYLLVAKPQYEAVAKVRIQSATGVSASGSSAIGLLLGTGTSGSVQEEIEVMLSKTNLLPVIEKLDLVNRMMKKEDIEKALKKGLTIDQLKLSLYSYLVGKNLISINPVKNTNILEVKFSWTDPKLAADVVNALIDHYAEVREQVIKDQTAVKRAYIEEQIPRLEKELQEAQMRLRAFKEQNKIYQLSAQSEVMVQRFFELAKRIEEERIALEELSSQLSFLSKQLEQYDAEIQRIGESVTFDPVVTQLKSKLVSLQIEMAGVSEKYPAGSAELRQRKAELEEVKKQLEQEIKNLLNSRLRKSLSPVYQQVISSYVQTQADLLVHQVQYEAYRKLYEQAQAELSKMPALEQELIDLERDYRVKETIYTTLLQGKYQNLITEVSMAGTFSVVDRAVVPLSPSKPNKKLTLAIGGVLGLFLGVLFVFLLEALDKTVKLESEAEYLLGADRIIARVPISRDRRAVEKSLAIAAVRAGKTILVTSLEAGAGKSFVSQRLASLLAQKGRTLLFTDEEHSGSTYDVRKLLELMSNPALLTDLKDHYQHIVIDGPTVETPHIAELMDLSDTVYMVVRLEHTPREKLKLVPSLQKVHGFVLNGLTSKNSVSFA